MSQWQPTITSNLVDNVSPSSVQVDVPAATAVTGIPESVKAVYCVSAGNLDYTDWAKTPNVHSLPMVAGQQLNIRPKEIAATSTGAFKLFLG